MNSDTDNRKEAKTLLVPLDFSDCSNRVLQEAVGVAQQERAALLLLHVVAPVVNVPDTAMVRGDDGAQTSAGDLLTREAEHLLAEQVEAAVAEGIKASALVVAGDPADAIIATAEAHGVSHIVMGTHGRTGLTKLLLGSVADKVTRKARQPVLTVKSQRRPECEARSCSWCPSHVTPGQAAIDAEADG